jgi:hypothetical protein
VVFGLRKQDRSIARDSHAGTTPIWSPERDLVTLPEIDIGRVALSEIRIGPTDPLRIACDNSA